MDPGLTSLMSRGFSPENRANPAQVKLIIGIDYGTSFSGAAYTLFLQRPIDPRIDTISDWPSAHHHHRYTQKVPSDIAYGPNGQVHCGFECPEDATRLRWVKLLLETDPDSRKSYLLDSEEVQATRRAIQELGKSPTTVVGDYLKWLWARIVDCICDEQNDPDLVKNSDVTIVMTVPAIWSDAAKENTLHAAELAGLADNGREIKFITEPEAAAISELQQRLSTGQVRAGDCVIVCDAGGGTVDVVSYQVARVHPMELNQVAVADGGLCGSVYIDQAFTNQVKGVLRDDWDRLPAAAKSEIIDRFTFIIKPSYEGGTSTGPKAVHLGGVAHLNLEHAKEGTVLIEPELVRISFESVLPEILSLIDEQDMALEEKGLKEHLKGILLVGGLGSSRFVQSRIEQSYPRSEGVKVWRGRSSWTSVVEGAVRCLFMSLGNIQTINTRLSRWNYGIPYNVRFDPALHRQEDMFYCEDERCAKAKQIEWLVRKGQEIQSSMPPQSHNFTQIVPHSPPVGGFMEVDFTIVQSDEKDAPSHFTPAVKECADIACRVTSRLIIAARHRSLAGKGTKAAPAWKVIISLEIHMLAARVRFAMKMAGEEIGATQVSFRQLVPGPVQAVPEPAIGVAVGNGTQSPRAQLDEVAEQVIKSGHMSYNTKTGGDVQSSREFDDVLAKVLRNRGEGSKPESDADDAKKVKKMKKRAALNALSPSDSNSHAVDGSALPNPARLQPLPSLPARVPELRQTAPRSYDIDTLAERKEIERQKIIDRLAASQRASKLQSEQRPRDDSEVNGFSQYIDHTFGGTSPPAAKEADKPVRAAPLRPITKPALWGDNSGSSPQDHAVDSKISRGSALLPSPDEEERVSRRNSLRSILSVESRLSLRRELDPNVTVPSPQGVGGMSSPRKTASHLRFSSYGSLSEPTLEEESSDSVPSLERSSSGSSTNTDTTITPSDYDRQAWDALRTQTDWENVNLPRTSPLGEIEKLSPPGHQRLRSLLRSRSVRNIL
ncbi:hypothetical protein Z517_00549 [Fonsecaea pedrosoi CBS 271.37]|uniref:Actin-like ATPase domain-containing protein n=1 Tax=Fonsecaea pedrosoi CBS 271.37 TaxID=1442368 RepID=A0A0D2HL01_9EURO|nr:uncharacterized protein Z517_00549 [Fonsecaea pedrosoi CBS 271.37]KIW85159.1 hypothetical protein Z517_00549 [Fonsecaea pedrosoi CBS 271.37]